MVRRQTDSTRFIAVLGVLFAVMLLGGASIWLAIKVLDKPTQPEVNKDLTGQTPPPPPKTYVDEEEATDPEPAETTTTQKTGSAGSKTTTKSGTTTTKSGTTSTKSGTTSTKSGTTKTIGSGANRNNRSGGTSGH